MVGLGITPAAHSHWRLPNNQPDLSENASIGVHLCIRRQFENKRILS